MGVLTRALMVVMLATSCSAANNAVNNTLVDASAEYRKSRSYASLETISQQLKKGMERREIEDLLGKGLWYPNDLVIYFSDKQEMMKNNPARDDDDVLGEWVLFLDYKDAYGKMTDHLQSWRLQLIGE